MLSKSERLAKLVNSDNKINALAIDQRGSLKKILTKAMGKEASDHDVVSFKNIVVEKLSPYASGVLLDPEYGLPALKTKDSRCGVLLAYEKSGYDVQSKGRLPDLLPEWSVTKLRDAGGDAIKLLVYYDAFDDESINGIKRQFISEVGAECAGAQMPFFLEIVCYSDEVGDEKSLAFAKVKPKHVQAYTEEFSKPQYGVDVLKVEFPINIKYVEKFEPEKDEEKEFAYTLNEAKQILQAAASWTKLPFIYLSAGVTFDLFEKSLRMANEAGVEYRGVLCGRATWQEGVEIYGKQGEEELNSWLIGEGQNRLRTLSGLLSE